MHGTEAGNAEGHEPHGTALPAPRTTTTRGARATPTRGGGKDADAARARAHTHATGTRGIPEGQPHPVRKTHKPHGMAYRRARVRDTLRGRPATRSAGNAGAGRGARERRKNPHWPQPPKLAASAAHTRTGHFTHQGSTGTPSHAPTPRLGNLRASPWGSHWRQASSTGPAVPAPRATTH